MVKAPALLGSDPKNPTGLQNLSQQCQNTICCRCGEISSQCLREYGQSCMMLTLTRGSFCFGDLYKVDSPIREVVTGKEEPGRRGRAAVAPR